MEYSFFSDKGIITTSSLSSSSPSGSPSSSSSPSTNYPLSPPDNVTSSQPSPSSSSSSSPNSPPTDLPPVVTSSPPSSSAVALSSSSPNSPPTDLPPAVISSLPSSSAVPLSSTSPNSPPTDLPPAVASLPSSSRSLFPPATVVVIRSCAACRLIGRICTENCVLATCFPPIDLNKFITVHRVFGATNIINFLQELSESQREDAVNSMVYEANARLRDPVYGCVGSICQLQKQVCDLQVRLAKAQAEVVNMHCQQANLMTLICTEMGQSPQAVSPPQQSLDNFTDNSPMSLFADINDFTSLWEEPLWT